MQTNHFPLKKLASPCLARLAFSLVLLSGCSSRMVVNQSYVDLRSQPFSIAQAGIQDPHQETQLLYGEPVHIIKTQKDWAWVEATEQMEFSHQQRWQGYPGWVPLNALSPAPTKWGEPIIVQVPQVYAWVDTHQSQTFTEPFLIGTELYAQRDPQAPLWKVKRIDGKWAWIPLASALPKNRQLSIMEKRQRIIDVASRLLGHAYYWGGRTPNLHATQNAQGLDCSGLTQMSYRLAGVTIPRDSHEQFMRAKPIHDLQLGDLIFLSSKENPHRIVHVMLYAGNGEIIEGPGTGQKIHRISLEERFGQPKHLIYSGAMIDGQVVYFGSVLAPS